MANLTKKLKNQTVTDASGSRWRYYDYERDTYGLVAFFINVVTDEFTEIQVMFRPQKAEIVDGWEYPDFRQYEIKPGDPEYDYECAVEDAIDEAIEIIQERGQHE